jgi:hypothetical protein
VPVETVLIDPKSIDLSKCTPEKEGKKAYFNKQSRNKWTHVPTVQYCKIKPKDMAEGPKDQASLIDFEKLADTSSE